MGLVPHKEPQCCTLAVSAPERARENLEESMNLEVCYDRGCFHVFSPGGILVFEWGPFKLFKHFFEALAHFAFITILGVAQGVNC